MKFHAYNCSCQMTSSGPAHPNRKTLSACALGQQAYNHYELDVLAVAEIDTTSTTLELGAAKTRLAHCKPSPASIPPSWRIWTRYRLGASMNKRCMNWAVFCNLNSKPPELCACLLAPSILASPFWMS